ncbi:MAG: N-acetylmuramoyl-L-alanine amidase [Opitutaceae bacterium]|nr:N-acetylmuramoyl-L-alanine amidase [Opitutaceae bacterium]
MTYEKAIYHTMNPESQVSYHVIIATDGTRCTLVPDNEIAWHAGVSMFGGRSKCNDFLLGCAFAGDTYLAPLTDHQLSSAIEWLNERWSNRGWTPADMTDHRQISPARKIDLNPVEWKRLIKKIRERFAPE